MKKIQCIILLIIFSVFSSLVSTKVAIKKETIKKESETKTEKTKVETVAEWKDLSSEKENWIDFKNIGDKTIIFGVHGVAETGGGWFLWDGNPPNRLPKIKDYDLVTFKWKQRKVGLPRGFRDRDVIEGAKELAKLILKIYKKIKEREKEEKKPINMNIIIIAHSMGGNVVRVLLNLLDQQITTTTEQIESPNVFEKIKDKIFRFITRKKEPTIKKIIDTRFKKNKGLIDTIKEGLTKNYYMDAYNEIFNEMKKLREQGYEIRQPIINAIYTLGTPYRKNFPFSLNMNPTKYFYALFSSKDEVQTKIGPARIEVEDMFNDKNNKFNIQVRFMEKGKIIDPNHDQLIRNTPIIFKILEINKEKIKEELEKYLKKFKEDKRKEEKEKIKTLIVTFQELSKKDDHPIFEFDTTPIKKERFGKSGIPALRF